MSEDFIDREPNNQADIETDGSDMSPDTAESPLEDSPYDDEDPRQGNPSYEEMLRRARDSGMDDTPQPEDPWYKLNIDT